MDQQRRREIASAGGKASHQRGRAHEFSADEARAAGRKGGQIAHRRGSAHEFSAEEARAAGRKGGAAVSRDRDHMAHIGRKGGGRSRSMETTVSAPAQRLERHEQQEQQEQQEYHDREPAGFRS